ncbi:type I-E CRISPR-associated protein Cas7/Cse4/CasC [Gordonia pseudamarae]|uniref:Type I-E CRISPR-associated protein Cas7/Cse4/CasC n=1 Tax=Gordonia pseudamarae TaxID=2831662 RepID=A0ABX6IMQ6_9ACTN|nr:MULTISPECIES: type I-E CRISPR-associated protein Cas7/Cse4/CasC [Gordonia]MBD0022141.1 type I-E CRISPR-associated protein Cas7/Cse4/CasC [Gordonia sp. (in: high G+C Gram-positive bacteria)]QHN28160.1 type I-E CRISPR-associated protein Cas7/Cse4/CasC [Gordonia pseudamarae]QHN37022.1 type I-E CRISPR-associated protein Cas7/Cse4/CasC [Gordonia pseudamarae]
MPLTIDLHIIQSVPPSNMNRDEDGSPKSTMYGGTRRTRVSSQAWKRAIRRDFEGFLDTADLGVRTLRAVGEIATRIKAIDSTISDEDGERLATAVLTATGIKVTKVPARKKAKSADDEEPQEHSKTGALLFLSNPQLDELARLAVDSQGSVDKKAAKAILLRGNSIDLALFGRMVADAPDLNVDAAAQVAHAIGTHASVPEFDYFTAVDEKRVDDNAGAGMIGTVEFNTATLYRYATVNIDALRKNLGSDEAVGRGVEAFIRSFIRSMPTGKQNTFANRTLPSFVYAAVRTDQPINLAGAFEKAVDPRKGLTEESVSALISEARNLYSNFDASPTAGYVVSRVDVDVDGFADTVTAEALVSALGAQVRDNTKVSS